MVAVLPTSHPTVSRTLTALGATEVTPGAGLVRLCGSSAYGSITECGVGDLGGRRPGGGAVSAPRLERMARWIESWLPRAPAGSPVNAGHSGEKFGLPADGANATASFGRRLGAIFVDWMIAYFLTLAFLGVDALGEPNTSWTILGVWYLLTVLPTAIFGMTAGMVALGLRVARTDMARFVGVPRALLRTFLIALIIPPLARDDDGRGWHDRATTTIVIRAR